MKIDFSQSLNNMQMKTAKTNSFDTGFQQILDKLEKTDVGVDEKKKQEEDKKLREACRQFESVFIHEMFKQMRKTVPENALLGKSNEEEMFQDMLDEKYSDIMSNAGGIGLAEILYEQLSPGKLKGDT